MSRNNSGSPIRIAVSRCLLGESVRYDGTDKRNSIVVDTLGRDFQFVPLCPEVEIGLGVPRPKIQLEPLHEENIDTGCVQSDEYRLTMPQTGEDLSQKMLEHCRRLVERLKNEGISGCILKSRSPSCGLSGVKVFYKDGIMRREGVGLFAKTLMEMMPELPVEEDDRIQDPLILENWLKRVLSYRPE